MWMQWCEEDEACGQAETGRQEQDESHEEVM